MRTVNEEHLGSEATEAQARHRRPEPDYRPQIAAILAGHARPGEDLALAVLAGSPRAIGRGEALAIARWLTDNADADQGVDPRHAVIAAEIRGAVE